MPLASTSITAYHSIDLTEMEKKVMAVIDAAGPYGCISDEIQAKYPTLSYSSVTARFSALEKKELLCRNGDTRPGVSGRPQQVMRAFVHSTGVVPKLTKAVVKKNPFLAGMIHAARIIIKEPDLTAARQSLKAELIKVGRR